MCLRSTSDAHAKSSGPKAVCLSATRHARRAFSERQEEEVKNQAKVKRFLKKSRPSHCNTQESNQEKDFILSLVFYPLFSLIYNVFL